MNLYPKSYTVHPRLGFTLIELLVSISIIVTIISLSLAAISSARARSRDAKRVGDLLTIQTALEQYNLADPKRSYPNDIYDDTKNDPQFGPLLSVVPKDPTKLPYFYKKDACLPTSENKTVIKETDITSANNGECNLGYKYGTYVLHVNLEAKRAQSENDITPAAPLSYDLIP